MKKILCLIIIIGLHHGILISQTAPLQEQSTQQQTVNTTTSSNPITFFSQFIEFSSIIQFFKSLLPITNNQIKTLQEKHGNTINVGVLTFPISNGANPNPMTNWINTLRLHAYLNNPDIEAILLIFNTNAYTNKGHASSFFRELQKAQKIKPIIALITDSCTDGCFYNAAGASYIIASPEGWLGSIGVSSTVERHTNIKLNGAQTGDVKTEVFHKGKYKLIFEPLSSPLTDDERAELNSFLQDAYEQFCEDIATARHLDPQKTSEWADGKIFSGKKAVQIGLIDMVGSFTDTLEYIKSIFTQKKQLKNPTVTLLTYNADGKGALTLVPFSSFIEMTYNNNGK